MPTLPPDAYQKLPKVELHRHLEGSLRLATMLDVSRQYGLSLPADPMELSRLVQVQPDDPMSAEGFLAKFGTLRKFFCAPEVIDRITREAIEDAARDNIRYMELRFTPVALSRIQNFALSDVMDWVCRATGDAAKQYGIAVRLIASVNRHEAVELAEQVASLAVGRMRAGIVGLDLAGNEAQFSARGFMPVFAEARQSGLKITIHAGEWAGAANVHEAIEQFNAARIGHGVRVLEDDATMQLARERGTMFEVCVTSNYQSGIVPTVAAHPLPRMLASRLKATLHTDDPCLSQITLSDEYWNATEKLGLAKDVLKASIVAAAEAAFLPDADRAELVASVRTELGMSQ
jgi:adenosine deaminase